MPRVSEMVGPLSSEEIEDVVSSVRRLVSNELRPRNVSRDLGADRLLLTPALRVVSQVPGLSPLILDGPLQEPEDAAALAVVSTEPAPAAVEPAVAEVVDPALTPALAETLSGAEAASAPPEAIWAEAHSDVVLVEAEWEDELWTAPETPLAESALVAEEAEVVALMPADEGHAAVLVDEIVLAGHSDSRVQEPVVEAPVDPVDVVEAAQPAAAEDALLEVEADADLPQEPALDSTTETGATPSEAPQPEAELLQEAVYATVAEGLSTELIDADGTPIAVLDEAALQDIVRQMIREELQGELGERITRNVRKLVRAEINRALIARDLD